MTEELYRAEGEAYAAVSAEELTAYRKMVEEIRTTVGVGDEVEGDLHRVTNCLEPYQDEVEEGEEPVTRYRVRSLPVILPPDEIEDYFRRMKAAASAPEPLPPIDAWRFEAAIELAGIKDQIDAAIDALPAEAHVVAKAKRNRVQQYHRDDPLIAALAPALNLSSEQVDDLWRLAASL